MAVAVAVATVVAVDVAVTEDVEVEEERRARLLERVFAPGDDDEGAVEEASARFRLRVSIQKPSHPAICQLARHGALITLLCTP